MSIKEIPESDMIFLCEEDDVFHIEKSAIYSKMKGVKMVEFLLIKSSKVFVVEARSSSPNPNNKIDFDDFIQEIHEKLLNALSLSIAILLDRHPQKETLPANFQNLDLSKNTQFILCLVIKGHKTEWLAPIQDELKKLLSVTMQTWALSPNAVVVMNDEIAREKGFIR